MNQTQAAALAIGDNAFWLVLGVGILAMGCYHGFKHLVSAWRDARLSRDFEESRREIAAYVAEGTMTPETAAKLLASRAQPSVAQESGDEDNADPDAKLANALTWGSIEKKHAAALIARREELNDAQWRRAVNLVCEGMDPEQAVKLALASGAPSMKDYRAGPVTVRVTS